MCVCRFLIDVCSNVALSTFRTVVSRKLTKLVDISCVNLIDSAVLFRWSINSVKESMSPFHIKMSSIKRTQIITLLDHSWGGCRISRRGVRINAR